MIPSFQLDQNTGDFDIAKPRLAALPPGFAAKLFIPERPQPRIIQTVNVSDIGALEDYLGRMVRNASSLAVFIDPDAPQIDCVLDHSDGNGSGSNQHKAVLALEFSEDFAPLRAILGKPLAQLEFLNFIDEYSHLFAEAARLRQMVEDFSSVQVTRFRSVKNLDNGTASIAYDTQENAEETTKVPREVTVVCPIFMGQADVTLNVVLRYTSQGGALQFKVCVFGIEKIINDEVRKIEQRLREFVEAKAWGASALIVRGKAELKQPISEKVIDLETKPLPVGLGSAMTAYTSNVSGGR